MSDVILKVENLYKRYRLGVVDRQAFKEDVISWWAKVRGKPDPYEQYITSNELANIKDSEEMKKLKARYVWALQDINFEIKQGEIVGIIGKNGAGKSTLLKILSKTTTPTKGQVKIKGRIASLLEVGTGFHGELTGRENIYLNGAILGMNRHEIKRNLDEIIDFAGVEAYIDTPVKRYSSGMYVRLAFAVGAHLLSDILIVDEVLAVGDAEFQKKCIGKMKDVSAGEGKTVLFVSHNITAVKNLCKQGIFIKNGNLVDIGDIVTISNKYLSDYQLSKRLMLTWGEGKEPCNDFFKVAQIEVLSNDIELITVASEIKIKIQFTILKACSANISMHFLDTYGVCIFATVSPVQHFEIGNIDWYCHVPPKFLNDEVYEVKVMIVQDAGESVLVVNDTLLLEVAEKRDTPKWHDKWPGLIRPSFSWDYTFNSSN